MATERETRALNRLEAGAGKYSCGEYIQNLDPLHRSEVFTAVLFDRLQRKIRTIDLLYKEAAENWNQTFYLLYFRTLGDSRNQEAYLELARRVSYKIVLRERLIPHAIEAMLLGASGLLALYEPDEYTAQLGHIFEHLAVKYEIDPMQPDEWSLCDIRPANHPVLRLAEAAEFFSQDDFIMDRIMDCRTEQDIRRLFCIEASKYWRTHYIPGAASDSRPKRIGNFKANIIGINLVAVLQFAYGSYTRKEKLRESALSLLEHLPAEENRYIRGWYEATGLKARNAFESQALLQLATEFCPGKRCRECPLGRRILHRIASSRDL